MLDCESMRPFDLTSLAKFEEEWVALTEDRKVKGHAKTLASLRKSLGAGAESYNYLFVPSSKFGFSGLA